MDLLQVLKVERTGRGQSRLKKNHIDADKAVKLRRHDRIKSEILIPYLKDTIPAPQPEYSPSQARDHQW